jgi:tryptophan-rich sensory protein
MNVGTALVLVTLCNVFIWVFNPSAEGRDAVVAFAPPGWVIGVVWTFLFAGLGVARWLVGNADDGRVPSSQWVFLFLLFCLAYPVYTSTLRSLTAGLAGNVATILAALWVAYRIRRASRVASSLVLAVAAWVSFATILVIEQLRSLPV